MPLGVIVNTLSVVIGGIIGALIGNKLTDDFKEKVNMIFGCCSMAMGISTIVLMENMPAVVFSVIIGTMIGLACRNLSAGLFLPTTPAFPRRSSTLRC